MEKIGFDSFKNSDTIMPSFISELDGNFESSKQKLSKEKSFTDDPPHENSTSVINKLRTFVNEHYGKLLKAFSACDRNNNSTISAKDFRNTLDRLFIPLAEKDFEQILCQVLRNPDGSIYYHNFLNQFFKMNEPLNLSESRDITTFTVPPTGIKLSSLEALKQEISEKFCKNVFAALKAFQVFDSNRNGRINKNSFRKVLNKFDFKLTNQQIEQLWLSENSNNSRTLDYNRFIQKLITSGNTSNSCSGSISTNTWPAYKKAFTITVPNDNEMLRRFYMQLGDVIFRHHYKIRKAFETVDTKLQGFITVEDFRQILESFMRPMSDKLFGNLMNCLGVQADDLIAWQVFLNKFRCPKASPKTVDFADIPREIVPLKNSNTDVDVRTVLFHLGQKLVHQFGSIENAFKKLDNRRRGWLTRLDIEAELKKLYFCLNEKEFKDVCILLDPEHGNRIYLPKLLEVLNNETPKVEIPEPIPQANCTFSPKVMTWEKVEQILRKDVMNKWEELKNHISLASTKANGLIAIKSLKNILDTFVFPIEEQHFQNLLKRYTTFRKDGFIDYRQFFEKMVGADKLHVVAIAFPAKSVPTNGSTKMEKKNASSREQQPNSSFLVTAQNFPYVIAEKSQRLGQHLTKDFLTYRKAGKDILTMETLQNFLKNLGVSISGSELNKLWKRIDPKEMGYAFYENFLAGCGLEEVYSRSNEINSTGYILKWRIAGEKVPPSVTSTKVTKTIIKDKMDYDDLPPGFILKEFFVKSPHNIWKTISNLNISKTGDILISDIQRVLIGYGLTLTDTQWKLILEAIGAERKDAAVNLQKFKEFVKQGYGQQEGYKRVYDLKDIENMVHLVVKDQKSAILAAFRHADFNRYDTINKDDFERILYKFGIQMDRDLSEEFWSTLPLNEHNNLLYKPFVVWFSDVNQDSTPAQSYEQSPPAPPKTPDVLPMPQAQPQPSAEEEPKSDETCEKEFVDKVSENLQEALIKLNQACTTGDKFLPPEVLKSVLESISQPISDNIFYSLLNQNVFARLDGLVSYQEFLARLLRGRSDNGRLLAGEIRRVNPSVCVEKNQPYQFVTANQLPPLVAKLSQNHFHNVTKGYLTFTKAGKDIINTTTLKDFLKAFNISMSEVEFNKLWRYCDPEYKGYITYEEFLERCGLEEMYPGASETKSSRYIIMWKLVEGEEPSSTMSETNICRCCTSETMSGDNYMQLSPEEYFRESLMKLPLTIWKTITDLDVENCDLIPASHLQNLLMAHGINMTTDDWKQVLMPFRNEEGFLNIKSFISNLLYGKSPSDSNESQLSPKFMKEIEKVVSSNSKEFLAAFKEADNGLLNTVSQESFQNILKKFGINMERPTFLKFWSLLPLSENDNLIYQDFLESMKARRAKHGAHQRPPSAMCSTYRPWKPSGPLLPSMGRTSADILPLEIHTARRQKRAATANHLRRKTPAFLSAKLVNAEEVEQLIKNVIRNHWKLIQKRCRMEDQQCTGHIDPEKFKEILLHFMKNISEEKFMKLKEKFDIKGDGTLAYRDLIRYFIFDSKPTRIVPGQHRLLRQGDNDEFETVPTEGLLGEALKRLRQCVMKNWRLMQRSFQVADPSKTDHVDIITFRQILKCHNVNLTEEEFFQIMSFYDKNFSASINYFSFLRAFL